MKKRTIVLLAFLLVLLLASCCVYAWIGVYYRTHFFEHTFLNGLDVSGMTREEAEDLLSKEVETYRLIIRPKEGPEETITGKEIGYHFVPGDEILKLLQKQNAILWLPAWLTEKEHHMEVRESAAYEEDLLADRISDLKFLQDEQITRARDAYIERQDGEYVIIPEVPGNEPDEEKIASLVTGAVEAGTTKLFLEDVDCYKSPKVLSDDADLKAQAAILNKYSSITVVYHMGGGVTETLEKGTTAEWFTLDEDKRPVFDREKIRAWVDSLADRYDTIGTWQPFVTSMGETVYPESRTYGWQMDRDQETEKLAELLEKGESGEREPVWLESAASRGENDLGSSYVEIDYTNQHIWYYKNGELIAETAVVTGNTSLGQDSPEGIFCIVNKEQNAILKGEGYETPVSWWMPFYEGVGIHDADTWRSVYGGRIFEYSGSHGCINTPSAAAALIYENIEVGTPVVCYRSGYDYGFPEVQVSSAAIPAVPSDDQAGAEPVNPDQNTEYNGTDSYDELVWDDVTVIPEPEENEEAEPDLVIDGSDIWYIPEYDDIYDGSYGSDWDDNVEMPVG